MGVHTEQEESMNRDITTHRDRSTLNEYLVTAGDSVTVVFRCFGNQTFHNPQGKIMLNK